MISLATDLVTEAAIILLMNVKKKQLQQELHFQKGNEGKNVSFKPKTKMYHPSQRQKYHNHFNQVQEQRLNPHIQGNLNKIHL